MSGGTRNNGGSGAGVGTVPGTAGRAGEQGGSDAGGEPNGGTAHAGESPIGLPANGGAGGNGGEPGVRGNACALTKECEAGETCVGETTASVCLPRALHCPESCPERFGGCSAAGECLPALALGDTCSTNLQCADGLRCGDSVPHQCEVTGNVDDSCDENTDCDWTLSCDDPGVCAEHPLEGEQCDLFCAQGLYCNVVDEVIDCCNIGRCQRMPPGTEGTFCDPYAHLGCDEEQGFACDWSGGETCHRLPGIGEDCYTHTYDDVPFGCDQGAFCAEGDHTCHTIRPVLGEYCFDDPDLWVSVANLRGPVVCQGESYCDFEGTRRCTPKLPLSEACTFNEMCAEGGYCDPSGICVAAAALNASCRTIGASEYSPGAYGTCAEGACDASFVCKPRVADGDTCTAVFGCFNCGNLCQPGSYCSENVCTAIGPIQPKACNYPGAPFCIRGWCCGESSGCTEEHVCRPLPVELGDDCSQAGGGTARCVRGAFCNADKVCQPYAALHDECTESHCAPDAVCADGLLGAECNP